MENNTLTPELLEIHTESARFGRAAQSALDGYLSQKLGLIRESLLSEFVSISSNTDDDLEKNLVMIKREFDFIDNLINSIKYDIELGKRSKEELNK